MDLLPASVSTTVAFASPEIFFFSFLTVDLSWVLMRVWDGVAFDKERFHMPTSRPLPILRPDALRRVPRSFAWFDTRLRSAGFLEDMRPEEIGLYVFLVLAADKQGLSCWRLERVERSMPCFDLLALRKARDGLTRLKLLAYRPWFAGAVDGSYQVLALPAPVPTPQRGTAPVAINELLSGFGGVCR